jgi:hypothetical protein
MQQQQRQRPSWLKPWTSCNGPTPLRAPWSDRFLLAYPQLPFKFIWSIGFSQRFPNGRFWDNPGNQ